MLPPPPLAVPKPAPTATDPPTLPADRAAWGRLCGGNEEEAAAALADLAGRHAASVYRIAHRVTGRGADAEEVRQAVFAAVWADRPAGVRDPGAYLRKAAANAAANRVRAESRRRTRHRTRPRPDPPADPATAAEHADEAARLRAALSRLPPDDRALLALRFDGGLSFPRIADALAVPPTTARDRCRKALAALRTALTTPGEDSP